jgi:hypothetical protein
MGKTVVTMVDNRRPDSSFIRYSSAIALNYADIHGYDFIYHLVSPTPCVSVKGNPRHAAWVKILAIFRLLSQGYESICYVDTDIVFVDLQRSVQDFMQKTPLAWGNRNGDVLFLNNKPWGGKEGDKMPCSGVIFARASDFSRSFVRSWYELDLPEHDLVHPWEQRALHKIFMEFPDEIGIFDSWMFRDNEGNWDHEGQWVKHVGHNYGNHYREQIFSLEFNKHPEFADGSKDMNIVEFDASNPADIFEDKKPA